MGKGIINEDIAKTAKSVKSPEEMVEAINNMEKVIKSNKCNILLLAYLQDQILENSKWIMTLPILLKNLGIQNIHCKTYKYLRMKKSPLSLHFLKNNFKIIKEICHENAS